MRVGIDIGSRTIKLAVAREGEIIEERIEPSGFDPGGQAARMLTGLEGKPLTATGYGRHLAVKLLGGGAITEIKAHALGVRHRCPEARTIVDVGGQDAKVILLDQRGRVERFLMNDKCAAGTGRFLEIMAATLGYALSEFGPAAAHSKRVAAINSMCTVFAESEVISLKNHGAPPEEIARAVNLSVVDRLLSMVERLGWQGPVAFSGGVARNRFIVETLGERLGTEILVAASPDTLGAVGAALHKSD